MLKLAARTLLVLSLLASLSGTQSNTELKLPGPPAQKLMLGTWSIRVQYESTKDLPKGDVGFGEEKWYPGPGGLSLVEEYREKNSKREVSGLGVAWWDDTAAGFRVLWCENTNPSGCNLPGIAKWEGDRLVLNADQKIAGKEFKFREVFSDISPNSFRQTLYQGETEAELKSYVTILATRK